MEQAKLKLNIGSLAFGGQADAAWMHGNSISVNAGGAG